ncbi:Omega-hydroxypalmitate O-feruloyl transferase [Nymphaea thermarum]|nr:Omega-hydroxypalmitate O-feruloyl transferase [Nymphaea thermarum]
MESESVTIKNVTSVCPDPLPLAKGEDGDLLSLSNIDRKCPMLMYTIFFYRTAPHDFESIVQKMKTGLEKALFYWYPAAGRLHTNQESGKLDIICNMKGALLVEASTAVEIPQLGDLSQYNPFYEKLVHRPPLDGYFSDMPLTVVQVTRFGCGGFAVGVGTSHSLFDGQGKFKFLTAWALLTSGRSDVIPMLIQPMHDRSQLLLAENNENNTECDDCDDNSDPMTKMVVPFYHLIQLIEQAMSSAHGPETTAGECNYSRIGSTLHDGYVFRTFTLSDRFIDGVKREIGLDGNCSTFEVVATHLWKARNKALNFDKERKVCLQFTMNLRNKLVPPLSEAFSGNAYVLASVSCTVGDLEKESLDETIGKIKAAQESVTDDYVRKYLEALDAPQVPLPPLTELTMVNDLSMCPFHKLDFGQGRPTCMYEMAPALPYAACLTENFNEEGGINVTIGLLPQHVDAFTHYFQTKLV